MNRRTPNNRLFYGNLPSVPVPVPISVSIPTPLRPRLRPCLNSHPRLHSHPHLRPRLPTSVCPLTDTAAIGGLVVQRGGRQHAQLLGQGRPVARRPVHHHGRGVEPAGRHTGSHRVTQGHTRSHRVTPGHNRSYRVTALSSALCRVIARSSLHYQSRRVQSAPERNWDTQGDRGHKRVTWDNTGSQPQGIVPGKHGP